MSLPSLSANASSTPKNRLLAALSRKDHEQLLPHLTTVQVEHKAILYSTDAPVTNVYFPHGGLFSVTIGTEEGDMVEALSVGCDGMVGLECLVREGATAFGETMLQVPDTDRGAHADTMSVSALRRAIGASDHLRDLLGRSHQLAVAQMMQSVSCNALHEVHERCCRWLLTAHDRLERDEFLLSQEFLAAMLGTRRQTVAVVAGGLQTAGLIRYRHGRMTILDRHGLEAGACECYRAVRRRREGLLPG